MIAVRKIVRGSKISSSKLAKYPMSLSKPPSSSFAMLCYAALVGYLAALAYANPHSPVEQRNPQTKGFYNPSISYSVGGHAICVSGLVPVQAQTTENVRLDLPVPINQTQATELILELNSANSSTLETATGPLSHVSGIFNISSKLCFPTTPARDDNSNSTTLQFLTHGIGFSKSYWDFAAPSNSYVDVAALAGRTTFSYDRLGTGASAHPDPLQVVQGQLQIAIVHALVILLRSGTLSGHSFSTVIGVGHSYGSALTTSIAGIYPSDFDAVVVTGFSDKPIGGTQFVASLNLEIASESSSSSGRFASLATGYLVPSTVYGIQYAFFRFPDFVQPILEQAYVTVDTTTLGEQFTMSTLGLPATAFTGPVLVLDGENDLVFCDGNCYYPDNLAAATLKKLFPNADMAKSAYFILAGCGHGVNLALNAPEAFTSIQDFVDALAF